MASYALFLRAPDTGCPDAEVGMDDGPAEIALRGFGEHGTSRRCGANVVGAVDRRAARAAVVAEREALEHIEGAVRHEQEEPDGYLKPTSAAETSSMTSCQESARRGDDAGTAKCV